eukprot:Pgem_evm1s15323
MFVVNSLSAVMMLVAPTFGANLQEQPDLFLINNNKMSKPLEDRVFDPRDGKYFNAFTGTAFCDIKTDVSKWDCWTCKETGIKADVIKAEIFNASHMQGVIAADTFNYRITIAFRGTSNNADTIADARFLLTPYKNTEYCTTNDCGSVHTGFLESWNTAKPTVLKRLQEFKESIPDFDKYDIHFSGHSFGGAIAALGAIDLSQSTDYNIGTTFTYGQPRIGNRKFADYYNTLMKLFRIVNYSDPVPHLPPLSAYYEHAGHEVFYKNREQLREKWKLYDYRICLDSDFNNGEGSHCDDPNRSCSNCLPEIKNEDFIIPFIDIGRRVFFDLVGIKDQLFYHVQNYYNLRRVDCCNRHAENEKCDTTASHGWSEEEK